MGSGSARADSRAKAQLARILAARAVRHGPVALRFGRRSDVSVDAPLVTMAPEGRRLVAGLVASLLPARVHAVGGPATGADAIAAAVAERFGIPWFSVRVTHPNGDGTYIVGPRKPGSTVALVDDVVSTGETLALSAMACKRAMLHIAAVVALVDREAFDWRATVREQVGTDVQVTAVLTLAEILRWRQDRP